jgi:hypothetical protein
MCSAWSDAVGVFWLTRLLREPDTSLRADAILLLASLIHPATGPMRSLMLQAWPEGTTKMLSLGLSQKQPPAVAAAALTFIAVAMASSSRSVQPSNDHPVPVRCLPFCFFSYCFCLQLRTANFISQFVVHLKGPDACGALTLTPKTFIPISSTVVGVIATQHTPDSCAGGLLVALLARTIASMHSWML